MLAFCFYVGAERVILNHTIDFFAPVLEENGYKVDKKNTVYHFLMIGLNTEGEGQIHIGTLSRSFDNAYSNGNGDAEAARKAAMEALKNDWKEHSGDIIPNFLKKLIWAWQDDNIPYGYFVHVAITNQSDFVQKFVPENVWYRFLGTYMNAIELLYYFAFMLLALIGCWHYRKEELHWTLEFLLLIIFGYFCMILISEAQSRYKCLILPYICPFAAMGINSVKQNSIKFLRSHFPQH